MKTLRKVFYIRQFFAGLKDFMIDKRAEIRRRMEAHT